MQKNIHKYPNQKASQGEVAEKPTQNEATCIAEKKCRDNLLGALNISDFIEKVIIKIAEKYNQESVEIQKTVIDLVNILDYKFKNAKLNDGNYMVCCNIVYKLLNKEEFIKYYEEINNPELLKNLVTYIIQGAIHEDINSINAEIHTILEKSGLDNIILDKETSFLQFVYYAENYCTEKKDSYYFENMKLKIEELKLKPEFNKRKYLQIGLSKIGAIYERKKLDKEWKEKINSLISLLEKPDIFKARLKDTKSLNKNKSISELIDTIIDLELFANDGLHVD